MRRLSCIPEMVTLLRSWGDNSDQVIIMYHVIMYHVIMYHDIMCVLICPMQGLGGGNMDDAKI